MRAKAAQALADSWSAGFACKRKQSLHSRCNKAVCSQSSSDTCA